MKIQVLSKKTSGGLFVQFDLAPEKDEVDSLQVEPAGDFFLELTRMEDDLRKSGEICNSPDTGLKERSETFSDASFVIGGAFEVRDEPASEVLIERIKSIFPDADVEEEYL